MQKGPKNPERSFGVSVGGALCLVAAVLFWRGHPGRAAAVVAVGLALVFFGLACWGYDPQRGFGGLTKRGGGA
mgnify:CR=1 FL=1